GRWKPAAPVDPVRPQHAAELEFKVVSHSRPAVRSATAVGKQSRNRTRTGFAPQYVVIAGAPKDAPLLRALGCKRHARERARMEDEEVKQRRMKYCALMMTLAAVLALGACKKKQAAAPPPPPPPPAPTATLSANPDTLQAGQSTTLSWKTENATDVSIDGIGSVQPSGSQQVSPKQSTTYRLTAKGPGGSQEATTRVTVTQPPPPPAPAPSMTEQEMF